MQQEYIEVKRDRFHLLNPSIYILQGNFPADSQVSAWLDHQPAKAELSEWKAASVWERFRGQSVPGGMRATVTVTLPEELKAFRQLKVFAEKDGKKQLWYAVSVKKLLEKQDRPYYFLEDEVISFQEKSCRFRGWVVFREPVQIRILDEKGREIPCRIQRNGRKDVAELYQEGTVNRHCGFYIEVSRTAARKVTMEFSSSGKKSTHTVSMNPISLMAGKCAKMLEKGTKYLKTYGFIKLVRKAAGKLTGAEPKPVNYEQWLPRHLPTERELEEQKKTVFPHMPLVSVVVPLYRTPEAYLRQLIDSVRNQTYPNWELCLSDGSGKESPLRKFLEEMASADNRIKVVAHDKAMKIADNTNAAVKISSGEFLAFADHDDVLTPNALFECVKAVNRNPETEMLYSDEDKMSMDGHKFFQPHMKPDFNPDLLCTVNYICHLLVVSRKLADRTGLLRPEYDGAQDYDFILRCAEEAKEISHIPKILYHWRSHEDSTAENPESKLYAFEAGMRAVQAHYDRKGIPAVAEKGEYLGLYRTRYHWTEKPLISILIPNKDHTEDLDRCIQSIERRSTYRNYEFIIIENNSEEEKTFQYYQELEEKCSRARVVYWKEGFNYSAINNFGASFARGEYLLLLNNDTEIINDGCLEELLGYCMRPDVGAVGARLYYEDNTIQHAGVVIGFGGIAGHCFVQQPRESTGYFHRIICAQDYSAVTAACMMVKKKAFDEVGGLTTELAVAFNDIDFCLKLRKAGYLIVYNPYAELYHYESKSRGLEDTPEKKARFNREVQILDSRWPEIMKSGDPYYSPNLTLESQDFSLKRI
jgi:GT2 family glycosyltransferase